ncbi:MAG TPA: hypothetical protein VFL98_03260 [Candidatus Paceibacterota bacterium]|nr:hypothetical protein [Candidatus Paceibacterota bacterium]
MSEQARRERLAVIIQTPERIIWEGEADAVSSQNAAGPFDILPEHANLITLIERVPIVVLTGKATQQYSFDRALLHAADGNVTVYGDIAENA